MLKENGIPSPQELEGIYPEEERLQAGPVAIIECFEEIPCDPCFTSCPQGAIQEFANMNHLPKIDHHRCNGCGTCIAYCPGLAIVVLDLHAGPQKARLLIPWEMLPVPAPGDRVRALNRSGEDMGEAVVEKVTSRKKKDRIKILSLLVPRELAFEVRAIQVVRQDGG